MKRWCAAKAALVLTLLCLSPKKVTSSKGTVDVLSSGIGRNLDDEIIDVLSQNKSNEIDDSSSNFTLLDLLGSIDSTYNQSEQIQIIGPVDTYSNPYYREFF